MIEDNYKDITAFGGLPVYLLTLVVFFVLGDSFVFFQLAVGLVLCYIITTCLRLLYFKERPVKQKYKNWLEKIDASSFPSLHSMRVGVLGVILSGFFGNIILTISFSIAVVGVVITRVMLKRHHIIDTLAGLAIGVSIGLMVLLYGNYLFVL